MDCFVLWVLLGVALLVIGYLCWPYTSRRRWEDHKRDEELERDKELDNQYSWEMRQKKKKK